jgi:hypothetical protein
VNDDDEHGAARIDLWMRRRRLTKATLAQWWWGVAPGPIAFQKSSEPPSTRATAIDIVVVFMS